LLIKTTALLRHIHSATNLGGCIGAAPGCSRGRWQEASVPTDSANTHPPAGPLGFDAALGHISPSTSSPKRI
jgi:hypothetical protein